MFKSISPFELDCGNIFKKIDRQWMLITAGRENGGDARRDLNTMTASWGGLGILWSKPVATCYIRPQRYTQQFVQREEYLSLTFFDEKYRGALTLCGSKSGRDCDKIDLAGLTPVFDKPAPYFEEADTVMICRKLYCQQLDPKCFIDPAIEKEYTNNDYHYMYICEITDVLVK